MYKNYIFDLYGTLVDINTDEESENLWQKMALIYGYKGAIYTPEKLKSEYKKLVEKEKKAVSKKHPNYEYIDIKIEKVFKALYTQKGVGTSAAQIKFTAQTFRCFSTSYIKLYDGVIDLLETLKEKGKKIYLLSNAQRYFTENEIKMLGLDKYFNAMLLSSDEECTKPDKNYYEMLFSRYDLEKSKSIMIGNDWKSDILGAYEFGIDSLYIHQSISPEIEGELKCNYKIMDGNFKKIKRMIVR